MEFIAHVIADEEPSGKGWKGKNKNTKTYLGKFISVLHEIITVL